MNEIAIPEVFQAIGTMAVALILFKTFEWYLQKTEREEKEEKEGKG